MATPERVTQYEIFYIFPIQMFDSPTIVIYPKYIVFVLHYVSHNIIFYSLHIFTQRQRHFCSSILSRHSQGIFQDIVIDIVMISNSERQLVIDVYSDGVTTILMGCTPSEVNSHFEDPFPSTPSSSKREGIKLTSGYNHVHGRFKSAYSNMPLNLKLDMSST